MSDDEDWTECDTCDGSGYVDHDCGEDTCPCLDPEDEECPECNGEGGWNRHTR